MSNQEKVQLTIRCAMQSSANYNVECQLDWTVLQLKQHLAHICSFKPEIERQRLIYAGRCLENEQKIHEVLRLHRDGISRSPDEQLEKQVIHMVYIGRENINGTNNGEGVRHRTNATSIVNPQNTVPNTGPISQPQPAIIPPPMPIFNMNAQQSHEAWLTAYNNYMAQMMQFYQQPAAGMPFRMQLPYNAWAPMQQYGQPFHITNHHQQLVGFPVGQQLPNAQPLMNGHQNAMQNQQQMPLAANMQAGNNEIQVQADFLDLIYKSIRFALLAMIIFLYSSLERFFFVLCVVALFWFVQMRRGRRNPPQPNGDHQQQAEAPREPIIAQNQAAEQGPIGHEERPMPPPPVQAVPASLTISGAWNVFSTVIQSFFTSLIPENQAPLEIN